MRVAAFQYVLNASRGTGPYVVTNDATLAVDVLVGNPANPSNPRNDLIILQQDDVFYGDADNLFQIRRITGTPSGSPVDPTVTGSPDYVILARVVVPAGATSISNANITNLNQSGSVFTVGTGGVLPINSAANRPTGFFSGQTIYRTDLNALEIYDGTAWRIRGVLTVSTYSGISSAVSNPYDGQLVTVQDTDLTYQYNGTTWRVISQIVVNTFSTLATAVQNPYDGLVATVQDTDQTYQYNGTSWIIDRPSCGLYLQAAATSGTGWNKVAFSAADEWDNAAMHDTVTNNSRITFPVAGIYLIVWRYTLEATMQTGAQIRFNGAAAPTNSNGRYGAESAAGSTWVTPSAGADMFSVAAADYVEMYTTNTTSSTANAHFRLAATMMSR